MIDDKIFDKIDDGFDKVNKWVNYLTFYSIRVRDKDGNYTLKFKLFVLFNIVLPVIFYLFFIYVFHSLFDIYYKDLFMYGLLPLFIYEIHSLVLIHGFMKDNKIDKDELLYMVNELKDFFNKIEDSYNKTQK